MSQPFYKLYNILALEDYTISKHYSRESSNLKIPKYSICTNKGILFFLESYFLVHVLRNNMIIFRVLKSKYTNGNRDVYLFNTFILYLPTVFNMHVLVIIKSLLLYLKYSRFLLNGQFLSPCLRVIYKLCKYIYISTRMC